MRNKILTLILFVMVAALLTACAGAAFAQSDSPEVQEEGSQEALRTINVSGSGVAFLSPDIAYINIGVHSEDQDAAEAVADNNSQANEVIDAIKQMGVADKDIKTTNFSIRPQQEYGPEGKPTGEITYIVDNSVYVTVRDLETVGELLNAAVAAGANSINGITFDVADKTAALSEARKAAMQNAQTVANELAEAAGVELGEIQTITTYSSDAPTPVYMERAAAAAMDSSVPISPGEMSVNVQVNVVYIIQ
jgi:uncharacterized protein YggE